VAIKTLDALVLASMQEGAQIQRIAALWCRAFKNRYPASKVEVVAWVKSEFGPVIEQARREQIALKLIEEVKRQIRLRTRRTRMRAGEDHLTKPLGHPARIGRLLEGRLGPAHVWVGRQRLYNGDLSQCHYIDSGLYSGLIAGLIPVQMRLRRICNPSLLVYRQGQNPAQSYWLPNHITTVSDAFIWVIPLEAAEFLQLEGSRVEHDGEAQAVRLITQFGTKTLPWRTL
jgi:hypothetical protein